MACFPQPTARALYAESLSRSAGAVMSILPSAERRVDVAPTRPVSVSRGIDGHTNVHARRDYYRRNRTSITGAG